MDGNGNRVFTRLLFLLLVLPFWHVLPFPFVLFRYSGPGGSNISGIRVMFLYELRGRGGQDSCKYGNGYGNGTCSSHMVMIGQDEFTTAS
jgi:hypothetical protein